MVPDFDAVSAFYAGVFGWETSQRAMPGGSERVICKLGGEFVASMMRVTPEMGPLPPNGMGCFAVADCDEIVERAKKGGAGVVVAPMSIPPIGRFATLRDPLGGHFSVIELDDPPSA